MVSEQLLGVIDNLPCPFSILEPIKGKSGEIEEFNFIYVNPSVLENLQIEKDKIIDCKLREIFPGESAELIRHCRQVMHDGIPQSKIKLNDDVDCSITKLNNNIALSWQICTEDKLKKNQYILRLILDHIKEGILVSDVKNDKVLAVSKWGLEQTTGTTIDEVLKLSIRGYLKLLNTYNVKTGKKALPKDLSTTQALKGKVILGDEWLVVRPDGSKITISINAVPIFNEDETEVMHTIATWSDVTEQKNAENALKESEERFRTLADNISQQVWIADLDGTPTWFNKRWIEFSGRSQEVLQNMSLRNGPHPEYLKEPFKRYYECIAKKENWEGIMPLKSADGEFCWFLSRAVPIYDDNGNIIHWFGTNTDITKQIKLEGDLADRLKEREVLLKELYHRTKNNMQIIASLLSIKTAMISDPEVETVFREMQGRIRAISLVHEKLYRSDNLSRINLPEYIKDLSELLLFSSSFDERKITFRFDLDEISVPIDTAIHCGLMITELVLNSIKHAFPGDMKGYIEIKLKQSDDQFIELTIADNGVGLKEYDIADEEKKFGLQLFKELAVKQLNGTIKLDTSKGVSWSVRFKRNI